MGSVIGLVKRKPKKDFTKQLEFMPLSGMALPARHNRTEEAATEAVNSNEMQKNARPLGFTKQLEFTDLSVALPAKRKRKRKRESESVKSHPAQRDELQRNA